ncbi:MAG TPA: BrnT family toxin [Caulobacteraceae bacterium]|nr:BrnT family toxin [Caulobacteraceae bacterium]
MRIEFDWDPAKAAANRLKHGVSFEDAMSVFLDPLALSRLDDDREDEERWVTLGMAVSGRPVLVVHTHAELGEDAMIVRVISARRPTRREARHYEEGRST